MVACYLDPTDAIIDAGISLGRTISSAMGDHSKFVFDTDWNTFYLAGDIPDPVVVEDPFFMVGNEDDESPRAG